MTYGQFSIVHCQFSIKKSSGRVGFGVGAVGVATPSCVAVIFALLPATVMERSAVRLSVEGLGCAVAVTATVLPLLPDAGDTVSHDGCPATLQSRFEVTSNVLLPPDDVKVSVAAETFNSAGGSPDGFSFLQDVRVAAKSAAATMVVFANLFMILIILDLRF